MTDVSNQRPLTDRLYDDPRDRPNEYVRNGYTLFRPAFSDPHRLKVDLSRFDAAPLIAFTATKEMNYGTETDGRISPGCGADSTD